MRPFKHGMFSVLVLVTLILFLFWDPVQSCLLGWLGTRAFIPYVTVALLVSSLYFSVRSLVDLRASRQYLLARLLLALPVWVFVAYWMVRILGAHPNT